MQPFASDRFGWAENQPDAAGERLIAVGATDLTRHDGGVELADPDSNEFTITRQRG